MYELATRVPLNPGKGNLNVSASAQNEAELNVTCVYVFVFFFFPPEMVEPGQDLLLAALSESGISPNDLFDIDSPDVVLANPAPAPAVQQVKRRT